MQIKRCSKNRSRSQIRVVRDFLRAAVDENRIQILSMLRSGPLCVCEIQQVLALAQNLVSHHLKVLERQNLVRSKKNGTRVYYQLNRSVVDQQLTALTKLLN